MDCAVRFDAPVDSPEHAELRDTAWMGGSLSEGMYLLGMLAGKNLFRQTSEQVVEDYVSELREYTKQHVSEQAAAIFCNSRIDWALIPYLRLAYHRNPDWPPMNVERKQREERAMEYLLFHLDATVDDLADHLGTTVKQVQRLTLVKEALQQIELSR
ncbi:hypothetical protein C5Y96_07815 [Blastopirellula marina]|uniref:Uncharacterized protein n=1 Tax=Blastopirellula marina TaxID=124 RepID=A0A2S8FXZ3_9BACT|nr:MULTISPECIES: hypothetical protein [Pirellulaceae]PQO37056.1 hypothetical protein C5Y96_07815 [Blastopirellula marina]RCS53771.1 hypothetical protein DTL36_07825 [Bremerella cremea]